MIYRLKLSFFTSQRHSLGTSLLRLLVESIRLPVFEGKARSLTIYPAGEPHLDKPGDEGVSVFSLASSSCSSALACYGRVYSPRYHLRPRDHLLPTPRPMKFDL